jgi:hypothetical protein
MAEQQRKTPDCPVAERYYAEYVRLPATEDSAQAALQEVISEKAKRRWQLISVTQNPTSQGLFLVWDTSGFFSG